MHRKCQMQSINQVTKRLEKNELKNCSISWSALNKASKDLIWT